MRVSHVIEELSRFNPDARVVPELEIGGINPLVECQFNMAEEEKLKADIEKLECTIEDLEGEAKATEDDLRSNLKELESLCLHGPEDHGELTKALLEKIKDMQP